MNGSSPNYKNHTFNDMKYARMMCTLCETFWQTEMIEFILLKPKLKSHGTV